MESAISQYAGQGFIVVNRTEKSATLSKAKKFNVAIGIVGFLLCFIGLIIYAIKFASEPDAEIVDIMVG